MPFVEIPGLKEAIERETFIRDVAFLGLNERIGPFEAVPFTLRHYLILKISGNPMLYGGLPTPEQLSAFLWLVSPSYKPNSFFKRRLFLRRFRKARKNIGGLLNAAREYIDESLQDCPLATGRRQTANYSTVASVCSVFAREHGWPVEYSINLPMKQAFQFIRAITLTKDPNAVFHNPSDRVKADFLEHYQPETDSRN
jgi:hypothetical protein